MLNNEEEIRIGIIYSFTSFPQPTPMIEEPEDYVTEIQLDIRQLDSYGNPGPTIGQGTLSLIHLSLAMDRDYPLFEVMDASASIQDMADALFNVSEGIDCWDKIEAYYDYEPPLQYDVCFLERLEVLPAFRKKGVGRQVISNIIEKFYASCGLVVVKAYPLQHEPDNFWTNPAWHTSMEYTLLEADLEKARYQLFHYYQKLGFVNPFAEDYFMIRPFDFLKNQLDIYPGEEE